MKTLSIRQPWAYCILAGHKRVENRTWATKHRGRLAIHAGLKIDPEGIAFCRQHGIDLPEDLPTGALVGSVELVDCQHYSTQRSLPGAGREPLADDPWAWGPVCWRLDDPQPLPEPIPYPGRQQLFDAPVDYG